MKIVSSKIPEIELLIIGDGPLRLSLMMRVEKYHLSNNIIFKGSINNDRLPELYSSAAISLVPSIVDTSGDQEGLGLVIIEALGCGCAVIASALPAITDVIQHEVTGLLFSPGDPIELAACIRVLLEDRPKRERLARLGKDHVKEHFDWQLIAEKYSELMTSLVGKRVNNLLKQ